MLYSKGLAVCGYRWRAKNRTTVAAAVNFALKLRAQFSNYFVGFDLVSQEDKGHPFLYFLDELLYPSQIGLDLPYFFHAGETGE